MSNKKINKWKKEEREEGKEKEMQTKKPRGYWEDRIQTWSVRGSISKLFPNNNR